MILMDLTRFYNQFREETTENLRILSDGLLALEKVSGLDDPGAREQVDAIFRAMHTIKGSSRLLGFGAIGRLSHTMENILGAVREGSHTLNRELIDDMLKSGDALLDMTMAAVEGRSSETNVDQLIEQLTRNLETGDPPPPPAASPDVFPDTAAPQPEPATDGDSDGVGGGDDTTGDGSEAERKARKEARRAKLRERRARLAEERARETGEKGPSASDRQANAEADENNKSPHAPPEKEAGKREPSSPTTPLALGDTIQSLSRQSSIARQQTVRVRVDRLDTLINLTGELVVGKQILSDHAQTLSTLNTFAQQHYQELMALETTIRNMRLTTEHRQMLEQHLNALLSNSDQQRQIIRGQAETFNHHQDQQRMLIDDLEQEVMAARMLPVSNVFSTLPRAVRELTHATNKQVELIIRGETTELDRKLLEALNDPLLHLVRNAIDHGIEPPDKRTAQGKPAQGQIEVVAEATGGEVHITIRDDGHGMQPEKIRTIAVKKGLISKENASLLSDQEALELIFLPGFSSAEMITDISGRGVGMDVVRTNITELGGQVSLESQPGKGTTITLILPLTIVTTRILLVNVGSHTFALPASGCYGIIWAHQEHIRTIEGRAMIIHEGQPVPLLHMADLMNLASDPTIQINRREPAILIGMPQRLLSVLVDQLVDEREAVVKPLGPLFEKQRRYSGAVQLGDGQLILLLNPVSLVQAARGIAQTAPSIVKTAYQRRPHLMIVEDSFTTRELIRSILQSAGYDVTSAVDGLDALDKLRQQSYDLVVTDVEMPRVDGFQLTSRIRDELGMLDLPVVIITSLASDDYRRRGLEAGAQAYIVKSQFNQDNLLRVIQQLLGHDMADQ